MIQTVNLAAHPLTVSFVWSVIRCVIRSDFFSCCSDSADSSLWLRLTGAWLKQHPFSSPLQPRHRGERQNCQNRVSSALIVWLIASLADCLSLSLLVRMCLISCRFNPPSLLSCFVIAPPVDVSCAAPQDFLESRATHLIKIYFNRTLYLYTFHIKAAGLFVWLHFPISPYFCTASIQTCQT